MGQRPAVHLRLKPLIPWAHIPWSQWRMVRATPDLRLPSQPQYITHY